MSEAQKTPNGNSYGRVPTRISPGLGKTMAARWDLDLAAASEAAVPEMRWYPPAGHEAIELVIGPDGRRLVKPQDYAAGGKYRSIVKLAMRMHKQKSTDPWMMATGWLIAPDLVVTAGHVACDHDHSFGLLKCIKVYVGYHGSKSAAGPDVQTRNGKTVVTPALWVQGKQQARDVSFIKLDKPFTGIKPFVYVDTPVRGDTEIGVVGYPGDKAAPGESKGGHMYEMFERTKWNIAADGMLNYTIDTFGGNSGSPVLMKGKAIGVHVQGGKTNKATVIGGRGNAFPAYVKAFTMKGQPTKSNQGQAKNYCLITLPVTSQPVKAMPAEGALESTESSEAEVTESLKKGLGKALPGIFKLVPGMFGPLGAIASGVIQILMKRGAESEAESRTIPGWDVPAEFRGIGERGIVAEAALQKLMSMPQDKLKKYGVFDKIRSKVRKTSPLMKRLDPALVQMLQPVIIQMLLEEIQRLKGGKHEDTEDVEDAEDAENAETTESDQVESLIEAFGAESDEITSTGFAEMVRVAVSGESVSFEDGVESLESMLGEAVSDESEANTESDMISGIAQRAMLAEAALQVALTLPKDAFSESTEALPILGFAKAAARIAMLVKKYGPKIWKWLKVGGNVADLGMTAYDLGQLFLAKKGEAAEDVEDAEDGVEGLEGDEGGVDENDANAAEADFAAAFEDYLGNGEAADEGGLMEAAVDGDMW